MRRVKVNHVKPEKFHLVFWTNLCFCPFSWFLFIFSLNISAVLALYRGKDLALFWVHKTIFENTSSWICNEIQGYWFKVQKWKFKNFLLQSEAPHLHIKWKSFYELLKLGRSFSCSVLNWKGRSRSGWCQYLRAFKMWRKSFMKMSKGQRFH